MKMGKTGGPGIHPLTNYQMDFYERGFYFGALKVYTAVNMYTRNAKGEVSSKFS